MRYPSQLAALNLPSWTVRCTHFSCSFPSALPCAAENSTLALTSAKPEQSSSCAGAGVPTAGYLSASIKGKTKAAVALRTSIRLPSVATDVASSAKASSIRWNTGANSSALPSSSTRHACRTCKVQVRLRAVNITVFEAASASIRTQACSLDTKYVPIVWLQRRAMGNSSDRFARNRIVPSTPVLSSSCQLPQR